MARLRQSGPGPVARCAILRRTGSSRPAETYLSCGGHYQSTLTSSGYRHERRKRTISPGKARTSPVSSTLSAVQQTALFDPVCDLLTIGGPVSKEPVVEIVSSMRRAPTTNGDDDGASSTTLRGRRQRMICGPIVHRRGRLADDPVRALRLRGIRCFSHLLQRACRCISTD